MGYKRVKEGCHVDKNCEVAELHSRWDEARAKMWCFILTALWLFRLKKDRCCEPDVHYDEGNLLSHARFELAAIGMNEDDTDEMNSAMVKHLLHMVREFAKEGHSGFSAGYANNTLHKLLAYGLLSPLSGNDSEWNNVSDMSGSPLWQNNRCSSVFKNDKGEAWDVDGKVFVEPDGGSYTNAKSKVKVTFPYTPVTKYVKIKASANGGKK